MASETEDRASAGREPSDEDRRQDHGAQIRAFLIADVRGYTRFTQQRGDEAAAALAARFAEIAREVVTTREGDVIELRGDEALAVFESTRQAIRAAIDLQERFVAETVADPSLPFPVGIGLDAGEAVAFEGGYRGGALNLAARLCGQAKPGEILASAGVTHLARKVDGARYVARGAVRLKNMAEPVEVWQVLPEGSDPAERLRAAMPAPEAPAGPSRRARWIGLVAAILAAILIAAFLPAMFRDEAQASIPAGGIGLFDPGSGDLTGSASIGEVPRGATEGPGGLWVTDQATSQLIRVNPGSLLVDERIPVGSGPSGVTTAGDLVWVANTDDRTVSVVDPDAHAVVQTVIVGNGPMGIAASGDRVWVTNSVDASLSEIDVATGEVLDTYRVGERPVAVAIEGQIAWVANLRSNTVSKVSSGPGEIAAIPVGRGPSAIAAGDGAIWVTNEDDGTVSKIDSASDTVVATYEVGPSPSAIAVAGGTVWVANAGDATVSTIDVATGRVSAPLPVGAQPRAVVAGDTGVWVAAQASPATHRGGTLKVVADVGATSLDPALLDPLGSVALTFTNDGLVALRRESGAAGLTVVPDLVVSLPVPTDGGRTFTFQLREGIEFSDGHLLGPADVVATFERVLTAADCFFACLYLSSLHGVETCVPDEPERCDLSTGIVPDDANGTVTFRFREPYHDFLTVLANPSFSILPAGTPTEIGLEPQPATGPYVIAGVAEDGLSITLERNPTFQEWSVDAQPQGFPDRIEIQAGVTPDDQLDLVQSGEADVMLSTPPPERMEELRTRNVDQLLLTRVDWVRAVFFDTTSTPFDDPDARRAVALALDRQALAAANTEILQEVPDVPPTCQILPPNVAGYVPYCPFTQGGDDGSGEWHGPDLAAARDLVESSGTAGATVTLMLPAYLEATGEVIAATLEDLGYRVQRKYPDIDRFEYYTYLMTEERQADVGTVGWGADYPSPAQYFVPLLACIAPDGTPEIEGAGELSLNLGGFCDAAVDRQIRVALAARPRDAYASAQLFQRLDRTLTDLAPIVPFSSPMFASFVSERVGGAAMHPKAGPLLSEMWVV